MTIEEFKNQLTDAAQEFFTTTAKDALIRGLRDTIVPALKEVAEPISTQLKEDAKTETGWVKFRDGVFLPALISVAFWAVEKLLDYMTAADAATDTATETEQQTPAQ